MNDLIKNEAEFIRNTATDIETGEPLDDDEMCNMYVIDAHRIADLIDAVEERNKELTLQLLATSGQAADALDKLAKAVEALTVVVPTEAQICSACLSYDHSFGLMDGPQRVAMMHEAREWLHAWRKEDRTVLAELEGGE